MVPEEPVSELRDRLRVFLQIPFPSLLTGPVFLIRTKDLCWAFFNSRSSSSADTPSPWFCCCFGEEVMLSLLSSTVLSSIVGWVSVRNGLAVEKVAFVNLVMQNCRLSSRWSQRPPVLSVNILAHDASWYCTAIWKATNRFCSVKKFPHKSATNLDVFWLLIWRVLDGWLHKGPL